MSETQVSVIPPLRGDGRGSYRVLIVGNSGSGKTTLGAELAVILGVPAIPLDTFGWSPGWQHTPNDEFREKVVAALSKADKGWVVDGNWTARLGTFLQEQATDIIWLDPPLALCFPRLFVRTVLRLLRLAPPCSPGCEENFRNAFFSKKKSVLWYCFSNHWRLREREEKKFFVDGIHVGGKRRRIGGWGSELSAWKQSVREMVHAR